MRLGSRAHKLIWIARWDDMWFADVEVRIRVHNNQPCNLYPHVKLIYLFFFYGSFVQ